MPKNRTIVVLSVLSLGLFLLNIGSCVSSYGQSAAHKKEMALRLDIEEKMMKLSQEKAALLEKIKAKEEESEEARSALQSAEEALLEEELVSQGLRDELQKGKEMK